MINKISLPIAIIISAVILGGFYYVAQINKIEADRSLRESSLLSLENCIKEAGEERDKWLDYWEKNSVEIFISSTPEILDIFDNAKEDCFKKYPQR